MNYSESVAKIEAKVKQKEAQRARLEQLERLKLSDFIEDDDLVEIEKELDTIKKELNLDQLKCFDDFNSFFDKIDLDPQELTNKKTEYIVDSFIVKKDITTLVAPNNAGKSVLAISIANQHLTKNSNSRVIYFDFDNSLETQAERGIGQLKEKFGKKLRYLSEAKATPQMMNEAMVKLSKSKLDDTLIVIDNIKNLIVGDRDKNKDVSKAMDKLKRLRSNGSTIIALHHTNKPGQDGDLIFAGSSAFLEDTANAYLIRRNDFKQAFTLEILKNRTGKLEKNIAFRFSNKHELIKIDFEEAAETEEDQQMRNEVIDFINNNPKCTYSQILQHVTGMGYSKDKVNKVIQVGKSKHWQAIKNKAKQNRDEYILIQTENISKKVEITDFVSDNSDSSDNSYFRGVEEREESQIESDNYRDLLKVEQNMNIDIPEV